MVDRCADQVGALAARQDSLAVCVESCAGWVMTNLTQQQLFLIKRDTAVNDVDVQAIAGLAGNLDWFGRELRVAGREWLSGCGMAVAEGWAVEPLPRAGPFLFRGGHAMVALLRQERAAWVTEATDAPNFLSSKLVSMPQWAMYVTATDAYAAAAVRKVELAYIALNGMMFRWMLDQPHTDSTLVLEQWLNLLDVAAIPSADRESVLADLLPRHGRAVAAVRQRSSHLIYPANA